MRRSCPLTGSTRRLTSRALFTTTGRCLVASTLLSPPSYGRSSSLVAVTAPPQPAEGGDSNPRRLASHGFSRAAHSSTLPSLRALVRVVALATTGGGET